jgi:hypothetical protein
MLVASTTIANAIYATWHFATFCFNACDNAVAAKAKPPGERLGPRKIARKRTLRKCLVASNLALGMIRTATKGRQTAARNHSSKQRNQRSIVLPAVCWRQLDARNARARRSIAAMRGRWRLSLKAKRLHAHKPGAYTPGRHTT